MESQDTAKYLATYDVKPSVQRMAVMNYLKEHRTHPNVDIIYNDLVKQMPTLSKTTVYNTLKLLTDKHAAKLLTIDEHNLCFDADISPHAHFLCTDCGRIFDVPLNNLHPEEDANLPEGFHLEQSELYLRGCCPECCKKRQEAERR